jgi:hypothetical protein
VIKAIWRCILDKLLYPFQSIQAEEDMKLRDSKERLDRIRATLDGEEGWMLPRDTDSKEGHPHGV